MGIGADRKTMNKTELTECKYIKDFSDADTLIELREIVIKTLHDLAGLTDFSFVRAVNTIMENPLITNPIEQLTTYYKNGYYKYDLMVEYMAQHSNQPVYMSQIYQVATTSYYETGTFIKNKEILNLNREYGYYDYYCMRKNSIQQDNNENADVLFATTKRYTEPMELQKITTPVHKDLGAICSAIDYVTVNYFYDSIYYSKPDKKIKLSFTEKLYLTEIGIYGKKPKALARELDVSVGSIYQSLDRTRKKFCATTTADTVRRAKNIGSLD